MPAIALIDGPGLKYLDRTTDWYGSFGGCNICGDTKNLIPRQLRYWDPDDGWKVGVLCDYCTEDARPRGPRSSHYAAAGLAERIDAVAEALDGDLDGVYSEIEQ